MRNALAHVPKGQHTVVAFTIRQALSRSTAAVNEPSSATHRKASIWSGFIG